jgi:2-polyprenyl-6-methoxyphenol hydroxylase-like FAD-dependent oxidoreductase
MSTSEDSVTLTVAGPAGEYRAEAGYVVGCDGGRGVVRGLAGIGFPGTASTMSGLLGDVTLAEPGAAATRRPVRR